MKIVIDIHSNEQSFFDGIIFNRTFECYIMFWNLSRTFSNHPLDHGKRGGGNPRFVTLVAWFLYGVAE